MLAILENKEKLELRYVCVSVCMYVCMYVYVKFAHGADYKYNCVRMSVSA